MLCQICKINEATIHIQEMSLSGEKVSIHICPDCAEKKAMSDPVLKNLNLPEMLYNITHGLEIPVDVFPGAQVEKPVQQKEDAPNLTCLACGWNSVRLKKYGRLGCPDCYRVFREAIEPIVYKVHKGSIHTGKRPKNLSHASADIVMNPAGVRREISLLQKKLDECVVREDYESAAALRDQIADLQKQLSELLVHVEGQGKKP